MTFVDLLRSGRSFDGELMVEGGDECSCSFVWDDITVTDYGHRRFPNIMNAECCVVGGGIVVYLPENVEYDDFYSELDTFSQIAAGYVGSEEYDKIFEYEV